MRICIFIIKLLFGLLLFHEIGLAREYAVPPPGTDKVGNTYTIVVEQGDTFNSLREQHEVSYEELADANPKVNFADLRVGQKIVIPQEFILPKFREGIVINVPELRLYYFTEDGKTIYTFPVALGRAFWRTPLITARVIDKETNPVWNVPDSIRNHVYEKTGKWLQGVVQPGPNNPLGGYAFRLNVDGYLIHGTNVPTSVGTFVSSGCIRLMSDPLYSLFQMVEVGMPVYIIYSPSKAGWYENKLYLETHKSIDEYVTKYGIDDTNKISSSLYIPYGFAIYDAIKERTVKPWIDWTRVENIRKKHLGIPEVIGWYKI